MNQLSLPAALSASLLTCALAASAAGAAPAPAALGIQPKAFPLTSTLVLPYFEVDTVDPGGTTTLFAIRNESTAPIDVDIKYFEIDSPFAPQRTDRVTLTAKQIKAVNIRDVAELEIDPDNFKRGYVRFEVVGGSDVLAGDFFRIDPDDAFASGYRLVNADPTSSGDERCSIFTFRFLRGGAFSGGTKIYYWLDMTTLPTPTTITYAVYKEDGTLVSNGSLANTDRVASKIAIEQLLIGPAATLTAGAIEIQLSGGVLGHVAGAMNASGKFSVGFEAVCRQ